MRFHFFVCLLLFEWNVFIFDVYLVLGKCIFSSGHSKSFKVIFQTVFVKYTMELVNWLIRLLAKQSHQLNGFFKCLKAWKVCIKLSGQNNSYVLAISV